MLMVKRLFYDSIDSRHLMERKYQYIDNKVTKQSQVMSTL